MDVASPKSELGLESPLERASGCPRLFPSRFPFPELAELSCRFGSLWVRSSSATKLFRMSYYLPMMSSSSVVMGWLTQDTIALIAPLSHLLLEGINNDWTF